jgi:hypothetical protein
MSHISAMMHDVDSIRIESNKPLQSGGTVWYTTDFFLLDSEGEEFKFTAFHASPVTIDKGTKAGSIQPQPQYRPDGTAEDMINAAIKSLHAALVELNREEVRFPIADGHIEDAWHAMKQIDTTTWTEEL